MSTLVGSEVAARVAADEYVAVWFGRPGDLVHGVPAQVDGATALDGGRWRLWVADSLIFTGGTSVEVSGDRAFATATAGDVDAWLAAQRTA